MPFTFSHPAIVLPLTYFSKKYYSLTGLIVGSVTPDFEYFIRMKVDSDWSHTISGMFWFDLPLGLILAFLFHNVVRNPLIANLPNWFYRRMNVFSDFNWKKYFQKKWFVILVSLLIGIASHLFWDGFTHSNGYFVKQIPALKNEIPIFDYPVTIYHILQHGSSLIGALVILYAIKMLPENKTLSQKPKPSFWIFSFLIMLVVIMIGKLCGKNYCEYGELFITGISGGLIGLTIMSVISKIRME